VAVFVALSEKGGPCAAISILVRLKTGGKGYPSLCQIHVPACLPHFMRAIPKRAFYLPRFSNVACCWWEKSGIKPLMEFRINAKPLFSQRLLLSGLRIYAAAFWLL
jgi:hypothetical protein